MPPLVPVIMQTFPESPFGRRPTLALAGQTPIPPPKPPANAREQPAQLSPEQFDRIRAGVGKRAMLI
jgi:hypothetical protein